MILRVVALSRAYSFPQERGSAGTTDQWVAEYGP